MAILLKVHPENPQQRFIDHAASLLKEGGIIVYPTDTIYGLGCSIYHQKAIERIALIKQVNPQKAHFSFVCSNLSDLSRYARQIDTPSYRMLKQYLPGAYTFILQASKEVPKILQSKKSTIGLRVPDNKIVMALVEALGHPILSTTLPGEMVEEYTDPENIKENFDKLVDLVIDGGPGGMVPSTVIDLTGDEPVVIREGKGEWTE